MIRLPNVLWEGDWVDLNAILRDTVNYPVVVLQSGIQDAWDEIGEDFFGDRPVIFPDQISWKSQIPVSLAGIYSEKLPPPVYRHNSASVWIYLSPEGEWSLQKYREAANPPFVSQGLPMPAMQTFPRHRQISSNTPSGRLPSPLPMQQVPHNWLSEILDA